MGRSVLWRHLHGSEKFSQRALGRTVSIIQHFEKADESGSPGWVSILGVGGRLIRTGSCRLTHSMGSPSVVSSVEVITEAVPSLASRLLRPTAASDIAPCTTKSRSKRDNWVCLGPRPAARGRCGEVRKRAWCQKRAAPCHVIRSNKQYCSPAKARVPLYGARATGHMQLASLVWKWTAGRWNRSGWIPRVPSYQIRR